MIRTGSKCSAGAARPILPLRPAERPITPRARLQICALLLLLICPVGRGEEPAPPSIELEDLPETEVICKIQIGPYWRLGQAYAEIGAVIAEHANAGPMFGRYLDDPQKVEAAELRTEVGFFVEGEMDLPPGFRRRTIAAHQAATLVVEGPYGMAARYHRRVFDWVDEHGYAPAGEIMEIFPRPTGSRPITEIRLPIHPPRSSHGPAVDASAMDRATSSDPASIEKVALADLLASRSYARAAAVVLPDWKLMSVGDQTWISKVVERLRVIREIVRAKYPGEAEEVGALLTTIVHRANRLDDQPTAAGMPHRARTHAVVGRLDEQKAAVLKMLDRLMVRVHLKKLPADRVYDELVQTLIEVDRIRRAGVGGIGVLNTDENSQ